MSINYPAQNNYNRSYFEIFNECNEIINSIQTCDINFLAIDFDLTMISIHTGGRFQGEPRELANHIRPLFQQLVPIAMKKGIMVAIVTFSPQTELISEVIKIQFPELYEHIAIRGNDQSWMYTGTGNKDGKQAYMAHAAQELTSKNNIEITRQTTLLIDDDIKNIRIALKNGTPAVHFDPENIQRTVMDLIDLKSSMDST